MNYRHAFHAGNFADVFKHAMLSRILAYLMRKDAPLRYLDTHAGVGRYDLGGDEASRTGEWRGGVARVVAAHKTDEIAALLAPWLAALGPCDEEGKPQVYPGSPALAQAMLRRQDKLTLCELHPADSETLRRAMGADLRVKALRIDGYMALNAYVPPVERRGLVLVDPPFESTDEFERLSRAFAGAYAKWPTGVYALWHPVKDGRVVDRFYRDLAGAGADKILRLELSVAAPQAEGRLVSNGLAVINPPFVLEQEARTLLPWLADCMAQGPGANARVEPAGA
ncbi:MAG: 23S rRNA (adenine(2030)-N(6))-methyltransferase RlmJ [Beijerinckiaceae bacterium]|nr:23S rRNA (adenine(2030)-N(6))-methyltransferase RlmJ [Beijerinckiaceae bacterium]